MPIRIEVAKKTPERKKSSGSGSSYKRFSDEFRKLPGAPSDIKSIAQVWAEVKREAKDLGITEDQIKKLQIQPAVNGVITLLVNVKKDKYNVLAKVSVKGGKVSIKSVYKPPAERAASNTGAYADFKRIFAANSSAPVTTVAKTWTQVKANLEPGTDPKDLVVQQAGKKIKIYAPGKKGNLKVVETISIT